MNRIAVETETRPLAEWLPKEDSDEIIYLTRSGQPRYVLVPLDEGDQEVLAIQGNAKLMTYIADCVERGRKGKTKSLAQIKAEVGLETGDQSAQPRSNGE
jgi:hypothetical protein